MLLLKKPLSLIFLSHKSATTCQTGSNKVSNSKRKLDLCNCVKAKITEYKAPPNFVSLFSICFEWTCQDF